MPFTARLYDMPASPSTMARKRTHLTASLTHAPDQLHHIVVHNLSPQGALIESYHPLEIGAEIALDIGGLGEVSAFVVWQDGSFYDCLFEAPVDAAQVRAKLTSARVIWGNFPAHRPGERDAGPISFAPDAATGPTTVDGRPSPAARAAMIVGSALICWMIPAGLVLLWLR